MSIFGMMRDVDEDPFFSNHRENFRRMEHMMDNFMSPFDMLSDMGFPSLMGMGPPRMALEPNRNQPEDGGGGGGVDRRRVGQHRQDMLAPFNAFGGGMFPNMRGMFQDFGRMQQDPNCHSFTSSSVYTYSTGDNGQPNVYQASTSTRVAPGGVKEVRKTVADSRSGVKKMSIGHHLDERGHVIEKTQDLKNGQMEENQEFINLEEEEADRFNREWQMRAQNRRATELPQIASSSHRHHRRPYDDTPRALPAPRKRDAEEDVPEGGVAEKSRRRNEKLKQSKSKKNTSE